MRSLASRLKDWFGALHEDANRVIKPTSSETAQGSKKTPFQLTLMLQAAFQPGRADHSCWCHNVMSGRCQQASSFTGELILQINSCTVVWRSCSHSVLSLWPHTGPLHPLLGWPPRTLSSRPRGALLHVPMGSAGASQRPLLIQGLPHRSCCHGALGDPSTAPPCPPPPLPTLTRSRGAHCRSGAGAGLGGSHHIPSTANTKCCPRGPNPAPDPPPPSDPITPSLRHAALCPSR